VIFRNIYFFQKRNKMQTITNKDICLKNESDKDLTSLLRISIEDRESGLRNYLLIRLLVGLIFF